MENAEMLEWKFSLKVERHFSPSESASFNQGAMDENALTDTPWKNTLQNWKIDALRSRLDL